MLTRLRHARCGGGAKYGAGPFLKKCDILGTKNEKKSKIHGFQFF